jgi:hypothetical protein
MVLALTGMLGTLSACSVFLLTLLPDLTQTSPRTS